MPASEIVGDLGADLREHGGEVDESFELHRLAVGAVVGVVAVLLAPFGIAARRLQMTALVRADPDVGPRGRDRQRLDACNGRGIGCAPQHVAVRESFAHTPAPDPGFVLVRPGELTAEALRRSSSTGRSYPPGGSVIRRRNGGRGRRIRGCDPGVEIAERLEAELTPVGRLRVPVVHDVEQVQHVIADVDPVDDPTGEPIAVLDDGRTASPARHEHCSNFGTSSLVSSPKRRASGSSPGRRTWTTIVSTRAATPAVWFFFEMKTA